MLNQGGFWICLCYLIHRFRSPIGRKRLCVHVAIVQWQDRINHVISRAMREGRVVYERA